MENLKVRRILDEICQKIGGDWLLVGGALVQLELQTDRSTEDVDLAFIRHEHKSVTAAQNELFQFSMKELQIGPESLNLSVTFFLDQIPNWKNECVLLQSGAIGNVFRPNLSLFIALKLNRASSIDLQDIRFALDKLPQAELSETKLKLWLSDKALQKWTEVKEKAR